MSIFRKRFIFHVLHSRSNVNSHYYSPNLLWEVPEKLEMTIHKTLFNKLTRNLMININWLNEPRYMRYGTPNARSSKWHEIKRIRYFK